MPLQKVADNKKKVGATFGLVVDTKIVTGIDIRRVIFVFDCLPTQILHGPTSLAQCMSLTNDKEMWLRQPRTPQLLQERLQRRSLVLSIFQPMRSLLMPNGKPPQLHPAQLQP
jgi:hypothetical protein